MSGGNASFSWHFKKAPDSNWIGGLFYWPILSSTIYIFLRLGRSSSSSILYRKVKLGFLPTTVIIRAIDAANAVAMIHRLNSTQANCCMRLVFEVTMNSILAEISTQLWLPARYKSLLCQDTRLKDGIQSHTMIKTGAKPSNFAQVFAKG